MEGDNQPLFQGESEQRKSLFFRGLLIGLCIACVLGLVLGLSLGLSSSSSLPSDPQQRALALMTLYPLIDSHNDLPWTYRSLVQDRVWSLDIGSSTGNATQTDIPRLRQGHVGGQFWSVYVDCAYANKDAVRATQEQVDVVYQMQQRYNQVFQWSTSVSDVNEAFRQKKIASLMGIEGGHQIDSSLASMRSFFRSGVRYMTLTHNCNTPWSESCCAPPNDPYANVRGLTAFGQDVVREMNRLGMMVDLSHTSVLTMKMAIAISTAPVLFSHSCAYALCPTARNVPDDVLQLLPRNGGVVMVTLVPQFVNCTHPEDATVQQVVQHMRHIWTVTGNTAKHIGIGADFDGISETIKGLQDVSTYPVLIAEMIRQGFTDDEVIAIMGGNILRVMQQVEQVALNLQANGAIPGQQVMTSVANNTCRTSY